MQPIEMIRTEKKRKQNIKRGEINRKTTFAGASLLKMKGKLEKIQNQE